MIEFYKVSVLSVEESAKNQILNAIGRAGEEIINRSSFQHVGFHSTPKAGTVGVLIADGENLTMIASADKESDRPDDLEDTTCIYRDKDKFVKIDNSGNITVANNNNSIILKSNGDIKLGESNLKKLVTESVLEAIAIHTHPVSGALASASADPAMIILHTDPANKTSKTKAQ